MKEYKIHGYKHDGTVHKEWDSSYILEETSDYYVLYNNNAKVIENSGVVWHTREAAIIYFFKHEWFNIVAQNKKDGITFYCNITSPAILEEDTIKYIDYDLDLRIFKTGKYKILDKNEYKYHSKKMKYGEELETVIEASLCDLISKYESGNFFAFCKENVEKYLNMYQKIKNIQKK